MRKREKVHGKNGKRIKKNTREKKSYRKVKKKCRKKDREMGL